MIRKRSPEEQCTPAMTKKLPKVDDGASISSGKDVSKIADKITITQNRVLEDDKIIDVTARTKPAFILPAGLKARSLHERLNSFIPELAQSNQDLKQDANKNMEEVDENTSYIQLELGLGVLEQKSDKSKETDSDNSDDEDSAPQTDTKDHEALNTLLGQRKSDRKVEIREVQ